MKELFLTLERLVNAENDLKAYYAGPAQDFEQITPLRKEHSMALAHAEITLSNYSALGRKEDPNDHPNNAAGH